MKYKIGDKVKTEFGIGEVLFIDDSFIPYLVGIKGYDSHSGGAFLTEEERKKYVIEKGYIGQCIWFKGDELELIKENK